MGAYATPWTSNGLWYPTVSVAPPLTFLLIYDQVDVTGGFCRTAGSWANVSYGYAIAPNGTNFRAIVSRGGVNTVLVGSAVKIGPKADVICADATAAAYWENGIRTAYNAAHGGISASSSQLSLGGLNGDSTASSGTRIYGAFIWDRALSDLEIRAVSDNPWQLFRPPQRRVWVPGADLPVNVTLEAAAVSVSSGGANLTKTAPLAGAAFAAAAGSGQVALTVQLQAAALAAATGSAALALQKALAAAAQSQASGGASLQVGASVPVQLGAAGQAQAAGGATVSLAVNLAAGALGRAAGSATLWLQVPLSAIALERASAAAAVQLSVSVSAAALATATSGASLQVDVRLQAAGTSVAVGGAMLKVSTAATAAVHDPRFVVRAQRRTLVTRARQRQWVCTTARKWRVAA